MLFKNRLTQIIIAGSVIEVSCICILLLGDIKEDIPKFSFFYSASFVVYIFTLFFILKKSVSSNVIQQYNTQKKIEIDNERKADSSRILWAILIFAVMFRLTLLPVMPSDDIYRYLWEGKLQLNWINPYSYPPNSQELYHLRDSFFDGINHKPLTTIYPPLTLMGFAVADLISHSIISMKSFFLFFDLVLIFILIKFLKRLKKDPVNVLAYAWSPIILISFAARGHCDSLQLFFVIFALYLSSKRKQLASVLYIGLAVVSKFISIIIVPFLIFKNKPKYLIVLFLTIVLLYIPYIKAGTGLFLTLFHFGTHDHFNDSLHFMISSLLRDSPFISKLITLAIFGIVLVILYVKYATKYGLFSARSEINGNRPFSVDEGVLQYSFFAIGAFLILAPTVHPWYLTWVVPFLCFYQSKAWLILTGTIVFYYFMNHAMFSTLMKYDNEWVWKEVQWLKLPEYIPFYSLLIYEFINKYKYRCKGDPSCM